MVNRKFYILEPEVAGGLGHKTEIGTSVHPPHVKKLHFEFNGWLGDDLLESFPCYIVTERLRALIDCAVYSGYEFSDVLISTSEQFKELYPERKLLTFYWLKVTGQPGVDDFGISSNHALIVSSQVLEQLKQTNIENCEIEEYVK